MTEWENVCVLCAKHGRKTRLETGHICTRCTARICDDLAAILRLAADAAAWLAPSSSQGGAGKPAFGSKPPLNVACLDPENTPVPQFPGQQHAPTVLELLEAAEREIREARGYVPYGIASTVRASSGVATLTGVVEFLRSEMDWITTSTAFGVEDFAGEVADCVRALKRWDTTEQGGTRYRVSCPTATDDGDCGQTLYVTAGEDTHCRRCGRTWQHHHLIAVAGADEAYVDAAAIAEHFQVQENTVRQWGRRGKVSKRGSLYKWGDVAALVRTGS